LHYKLFILITKLIYSINIPLLQQALTDGYVKVQKHPQHDLFIYNYTPKAQYEKYWNEITLACRGLILDDDYNIIARPFVKFFNWGEIPDQELPATPFEVYEKMDGSLGILYWINKEPFIATRGSFTSTQAVVATQMLQQQYAAAIPQLDKTKTYLFEIIYPENRIVVNYGVEKRLYLLAVIDTQTGAEPEPPSAYAHLGFPVVKAYDGVQDFNELKGLEEANKEGFVIRFQTGLRLKVKFEEYLRIHRIVTQVSNVIIWEYLKDNKSMEPLLDKVPDEFYDWVKATIQTLQQQYQEIENTTRVDFKILDTRKATAEYYFTCKYPAVLFKMMDGKPYDYIIWKMIRPTFEKPFTNTEEGS
jgi:tRNA splicing ligase